VAVKAVEESMRFVKPASQLGYVSHWMIVAV
jgi:hypothetical protein